MIVWNPICVPCHTVWELMHYTEESTDKLFMALKNGPNVFSVYFAKEKNVVTILSGFQQSQHENLNQLYYPSFIRRNSWPTPEDSIKTQGGVGGCSNRDDLENIWFRSDFQHNNLSLWQPVESVSMYWHLAISTHNKTVVRSYWMYRIQYESELFSLENLHFVEKLQNRMLPVGRSGLPASMATPLHPLWWHSSLLSLCHNTVQQWRRVVAANHPPKCSQPGTEYHCVFRI